MLFESRHGCAHVLDLTHMRKAQRVEKQMINLAPPMRIKRARIALGLEIAHELIKCNELLRMHIGQAALDFEVQTFAARLTGYNFVLPSRDHTRVRIADDRKAKEIIRFK